MHTLQRNDAERTGPAVLDRHLRTLFESRDFDEAEMLLAEALAALDSDLAWSCLELPREAVVLAGWTELADAISLHRGDPITGVTIALASVDGHSINENQARGLKVRLRVDTATSPEAYDISAWPAARGFWKEVEANLEIEGLDLLDARLAYLGRHDDRRIDGPSIASQHTYQLMLGCWWRALRWHQAVATECRIRRLPGAIPVRVGLVGMHPEVFAVHQPAPVVGFAGSKDACSEHLLQCGEPDLSRCPGDGKAIPKPKRRNLWARILGQA